MAYVSQDKKKSLTPAIKAVLTKYGMKGTISVNRHMSLAVTLTSGKLDLIGDANRSNEKNCRYGDIPRVITEYFQVNEYHCVRDATDKNISSFYDELIKALRGPDWFDNSDIQSDYFSVSHYIDINVGKWNKPYVLVKQ